MQGQIHEEMGKSPKKLKKKVKGGKINKLHDSKKKLLIYEKSNLLPIMPQIIHPIMPN